MSDNHPAIGIAKAAEGPNMAFIADCLRNYAALLDGGNDGLEPDYASPRYRGGTE